MFPPEGFKAAPNDAAERAREHFDVCFGYQLKDGTILWLSEAEWWELMDQAIKDED